jgi:hypothetical protein
MNSGVFETPVCVRYLMNPNIFMNSFTFLVNKTFILSVAKIRTNLLAFHSIKNKGLTTGWDNLVNMTMSGIAWRMTLPVNRFLKLNKQGP